MKNKGEDPNQNENSNKNEQENETKHGQIFNQLLNLTIPDLVGLIHKIDESIDDTNFKVEKIPDPNYFGEAPLYISPISTLNNVEISNIEYSGVATMAMVTFLNYSGILFPSFYLFPIFSLFTINSIFKLFMSTKLRNRFIYQINLINEHKIRVVYINGDSEIIEIKNIHLTTNFLNKIQHLSTIKLQKQYEERANRIPLVLEVRINGNHSSYIYLKQIAFPNIMHIGFSELSILLGILNKKTKKLTT